LVIAGLPSIKLLKQLLLRLTIVIVVLIHFLHLFQSLSLVNNKICWIINKVETAFLTDGGEQSIKWCFGIDYLASSSPLNFFFSFHNNNNNNRNKTSL